MGAIPSLGARKLYRTRCDLIFLAIVCRWRVQPEDVHDDAVDKAGDEEVLVGRILWRFAGKSGFVSDAPERAFVDELVATDR